MLRLHAPPEALDRRVSRILSRRGVGEPHTFLVERLGHERLDGVRRDQFRATSSALLAVVSANQFESMNEDDLLVSLESNLNSALSSEARGDADAAVAKTAAIKNIQKALTARILKRLDDGQPLVEVARKMKAIEGMQP